MSRRQLFQYLGASVLAGAGAARAQDAALKPFRHYPFDPVAAQNFERALHQASDSGLFGILDVSAALTVRVTPARVALMGSNASSLMLYEAESQGRAYRNPTLRLQQGARLRVQLMNQMPESTILHWHGLLAPAAMDGMPQSTIAPAARFDYDFVVKNRGGLYWYHSHAHEHTASQAYRGLAGMILVEDDDQRRVARALDLTPGDTEWLLVLQDKQFDAQGRLRYQPNDMEAMMGWLGDVAMVNLTPNPVQTVARRSYRLRLLNGANARIYRLAFVRGNARLPFDVIGTDGGLLAQPQRADEAFLAPGERLDLVFDAAQAQPGETVFLTSLGFDAMDNEGDMSSMPGMGESTSRLQQGEPFHVLKLTVDSGERGMRAPPALPARLSDLPPVALDQAHQRDISLSLRDMDFLINGRSFDMSEVAFEVRRGSTEIWTIRNAAQSMPHPIHLHGFSFQVIERLNSPEQVARVARYGDGRTVSDLGWKDTVLLWPGETVRIAIVFQHDFAGDQVYMLHCHNLEHEDGGMMINYRVAG